VNEKLAWTGKRDDVPRRLPKARAAHVILGPILFLMGRQFRIRGMSKA